MPGESRKPQEEVPKAETPQQESFVERLKRLSKEGHPSGKFVKGSNLGPITLISTGPAVPPKDDPKANCA